ncbi:MAG: hypothetical protein JNJ90_20510 [Saprospiraceae bacterium]|jgi:hypothetical protein|nr:hypothetical protein [Saprospiraceae bacterium]
MNARRFCLSALFTLIAATNNPLPAAKLSESDEPFAAAAFNMPETTGHSFGAIVVGLGVGAALGWLLLSVCVAAHIREERRGLFVRDVSSQAHVG